MYTLFILSFITRSYASFFIYLIAVIYLASNYKDWYSLSGQGHEYSLSGQGHEYSLSDQKKTLGSPQWG
jgi:hypothetical protein